MESCKERKKEVGKMEGKNKRMGVLVGCNYPNTKYELHGCINDVNAMREKLVSRFGFDASHIEVLTDEPGSMVMPTGTNIRSALDRMVSRAEPGDVLFFHYSGHGTRVPSQFPGNFLRQDEAIVPSDFNLITDVDFRHLVNHVPKGATFTMISDSCYSGGLIDKEKEQIGPSTNVHGAEILPSPTTTSKSIPFASILQHLPSPTNLKSTDIATHFLESFGADSSLKFQTHRRDLDSLNSVKPDGGVLLSGCQANESSADVNPTDAGGKAYGAFSNAVEKVVEEINWGRSVGISNKQVVVMAREKLKAQGFAQHPCLYCSDANADAVFLGWPKSSGRVDIEGSE